MPIQTDTMLLQMALVGYEAELQKVQAKIDEIQAQLRGRSRRTTVTTAQGARKRRTMSGAARRRIVAAQKKRWAAYRKKQKAA